MKHILIGLTALMITTSAVQADDMIVAHPDSLKWGPAPPVLPKGAEIAVVTGDPSKAGSYVIRVKVPTNYQIPAHWHSQAENLTVLSGVVNVGRQVGQESQQQAGSGRIHLSAVENEPLLVGQRPCGVPDSRRGTI
jgi:hypothetical protein